MKLPLHIKIITLLAISVTIFTVVQVFWSESFTGYLLLSIHIASVLLLLSLFYVTLVMHCPKSQDLTILTVREINHLVACSKDIKLPLIITYDSRVNESHAHLYPTRSNLWAVQELETLRKACDLGDCSIVQGNPNKID